MLLLFAAVTSAAVVDRIAVVVGKNVFTESEVLDDLRMTEFLNQQPLDLGAAKRREAADKLVDQQLLRDEMALEHYVQPKAAQADAMLANFRREHFGTVAQYRAALAKYGVTEDQVKQRLLWQLTVIQFTEARFRPELAPPPAANAQAVDRLKAGAHPAAAAANATNKGATGSADRQAGKDVDQLLDQWLKQQRTSTRVVIKQEAFQ